ncbi:MAG: DUF3794 domain-containing protein, partial [Eubacteriales bacterium]|nr:DUF3794 domain-containing protein [Eubacteriales bacterium]
SFQVVNSTIVPKKNEMGDCILFALNMDVDTTVEYYRELDEPMVTDLYHFNKEVEYDLDEVELTQFCGNGIYEATTREIINIPEQYGNDTKVIYISGYPAIRKDSVEQGKCLIEGVIPLKVICLGGEEGKTPFSLYQDLNFRGSMEIPGCRPDMETDSEVTLKEIWFDQINSRQLEVNASIGISTNLFGQSKEKLIQSVSFLESEQTEKPKAGIVVYVARDGDNLWKVAKRYRTSVQQVREFNDLTEKDEIKKGTKLLIINKC